MISRHTLPAVVLLLACLAVACSSDNTDAASQPVTSPSPSPAPTIAPTRVATPAPTPAVTPATAAAQPASLFCSDMKPVPVECQLAVIDKGPVRSNDPALASYRAVLARLERKCRASREQIASGVVAGKQLLKERKGVSITALKLLEATDTAIPDGNPLGVSCPEIIGSIVVLTSR